VIETPASVGKMIFRLGDVLESTARAALGLYVGRLPATELPGHGERSCRVSCVIGMPRPDVATPPIWLRFIARTTALRTGDDASGRPGFWLKKNSSGNPIVTRLKSFCLFSRARSAPEITATLTPPVTRRLAAVCSFGMTFSTTRAGSFAAAVVAPFGPHL
jgi:hypothetical protein